MARTRTGDQTNMDSAAERGIRGKEIKVLHETHGNGSGSSSPLPGPDGVVNMQHGDSTHQLSKPPSPRPSTGGIDPKEMASHESSDTEIGNEKPPGIHFADPPRTRDGNGQPDVENHISFIQNQRKPSTGKALRIPGPREFEKGHRAVEVDDDDTYTLHQSATRDDGHSRLARAPSRSFSMGGAATNASMNLRNRKFPTMDRILPTATTAMASVFSVGTAPQKVFRPFSRTGTVDQPEMPYLSYKPTVGRNSQFVDLTDEQRDELGGIEYRSLKLLVKILLGKPTMVQVSTCR